MTFIPVNKGQKTMANSESAAIASDQTAIPITDSTGNTLIGNTNEIAPASDTASAGLNGRLQRIAQRLTSLMGLFPASLGQKTMANSLAVTLASDQSAIPVTDGPLTTATNNQNTLIGAVTETAPASDTASSGLNGRLQRIAQNITALLTNLGSIGDTAAASDTAASTVNAKLSRVAQNISSSNSLLGATNETAPASDTASSGLNGRLQRIAQNLTSLSSAITSKLPSSIGRKNMVDSLSVTIATDSANIPVYDGSAAAQLTGLQTILGQQNDLPPSLDDGNSSINGVLKKIAQNVTNVYQFVGLIGDSPASSDSAAASLNAKLSRVAQRLTSLMGLFPASLGQKTMANSLAVTLASDQSAIPVTVTGASNTDTLLGPVTETAPTTDTASSGLNGRLQRVAQRLTSLLALLPSSLGQKTMANSLAVVIASDQAAISVTVTGASNTDTLLGALTETTPTTDTASSGLNGRLQRVAQRLTSLIGLFPTSLGQKAMAASLAVTIASDQSTINVVDSAQNTLIGAVTETAPASDTASSGLNGRLQRIAQRLTSLMALLPTSLGQKTMANGLAVTLASDQSEVATKVADGSNITLGAKSDTVATTATGTFSGMALLKWIASKIPMAVDTENTAVTNTKPLLVGGKAWDLSALTALTAGNVAMLRVDLQSGAIIMNQGDANAVIDSMTFSERSVKSSLEITRPADGNVYAAGDCISGSTSNTSLYTFTGVSLGSSTSSGFGSLTYDGGGYITSLKFTTNDGATISKNLLLLLFDDSLTTTCQDNQAFAESYATAKVKVCKIPILNIAYATNYTISTSPPLLEVHLQDLRIPFKNTGTTFKMVLITNDVFTPTSGAKYNIELIISANK